MRKLFSSLLILTAAAAAQTFTLSGPANIAGGQSLTLTLACTGCTGKAVQALQVDISANGLAGLACTAAAALSGASKSASCAPVGQTFRLVGAGVNLNNIADGTLATFTGTVPTSQAGKSLTFTMTGALGATSGGTAPNLTVSAVTVAVAPPLAVGIISPCDLNQDGLTNATDEGLAVQQILGLPVPAGTSSADLDGSGTIDVKDLLRIVIAVNGGACIVGP